jgi:hypothetical protein
MIGYGMCSYGTEETSAPAFNERDNYLWSSNLDRTSWLLPCRQAKRQLRSSDEIPLLKRKVRGWILKSIHSGRGEVKSQGWGRNTIDERLSGEVWVKGAKQYIANCGVADNRSMLKR